MPPISLEQLLSHIMEVSLQLGAFHLSWLLLTLKIPRVPLLLPDNKLHLEHRPQQPIHLILVKHR
jgi:hypothetical protein